MFPTGYDPTSRAAAIANVLNSSTEMMEHLNSELKRNYLSLFNDYCISFLAGRNDGSNPPQPPAGYKLGDPDEYGFQWPQLGTSPVCPQPSMPAGPPPATTPAPAAVQKIDALPTDPHKEGDQVTGAYLVSVGNAPETVGSYSALWTLRVFRLPFGTARYWSAPGVV